MDSLLLQKMVGQTFDLVEESKDAQEATCAGLPGVFYRIDMGRGTFRLQGESRIHGDSEGNSGLNFFATSRLELAEVVVDQLFKRRFPLDMEEFCNISDPGESWWMTLEDSQITIFLGGHYSDEKIHLGPMGDGVVAHSLLKRGEGWLRRLFPIEELDLTPKHLALSTSDGSHAIFQQFCNIFVRGEEPQHPSFGTSSLSLYFDELAVVRRFWLHLQESVLAKVSRDC